MTYVLFGVRMAAHLWRFNSKLGPFGPSAFWNDVPSSGNSDVRNGKTVSGTDTVQHLLLEPSQEVERGI